MICYIHNFLFFLFFPPSCLWSETGSKLFLCTVEGFLFSPTPQNQNYRVESSDCEGEGGNMQLPRCKHLTKGDLASSYSQKKTKNLNLALLKTVIIYSRERKRWEQNNKQRNEHLGTVFAERRHDSLCLPSLGETNTLLGHRITNPPPWLQSLHGNDRPPNPPNFTT